MKKLTSSFLFLVILLMAFALFSACSFEKTGDYSVNVSNFPYGTNGCSIKLQSYDSAGYLFDDFELGTINDSRMSFSVQISSEATFFYVYIYDDSGIKYYGGCPIENESETSYDISGYWYIYYEYGPENDAPYIALDEKDFVTLKANQEVVYNYAEAPVAVYELNNVKNNKIIITCTEGRQVFMYLANNKEDLMTYNMDYIADSIADSLIFTGSYVLTPKTDSLYFLVRPKCYDTENINSYINFKIIDENQKQNDSVVIGKTLQTNDNKLLFIEQNKDGENKESVYSIDLKTEEIERIVKLEKEITDIFVENKNLYMASGKTVFCYDLEKDQNKVLFKFDDFVTEILSNENKLEGFRTLTNDYDSEFKIVKPLVEVVKTETVKEELSETEIKVDDKAKPEEQKEKVAEQKTETEPEVDALTARNNKIAKMFETENETIKAIVDYSEGITVVTNKTEVICDETYISIIIHKLDKDLLEQKEIIENEKKTLEQAGIKPLHFIR